MTNVLTLLEIIQQIDSFGEDLNLFLPTNWSALNVNTKCILVDDGEIKAQKELKKFQYGLELYALKDVIENLKDQIWNFSPQEAVEAIEFYLKNDAFIDKNF